ncbi:MAG TPA: glycosyltransferase family 4 protein, partial [Armatimonadota bacterium]|nr:glycosyltransferase family 4 protein [Armatimonadota bacterium]
LRTEGQQQFARALFGYLCRFRAAYDVVHVHGLGSEVFAAIAAKWVTGRPVVVKPSSAGPGSKLALYARITRACPLLLPLLWRRVDMWVSISEQTRADLLRLGARPERIADIPNGVDTGHFRPLPATERSELRASLGLGPEEVILCIAARLLPVKRVELLIRAFQDLAADLPQARLWIIGGGQQRRALESLAREAFDDRIRFWGNQPAGRVRRLFQAADVFAMFSRWEGLSNALLEAMACGLPAVVGNVSGMADVVQHGRSGLLVDAETPGAIREALSALVRDAAARQAMGQAARERVQRDFSLERTVQKLRCVYRHCLSGASARIAFLPDDAPVVPAPRA